MTLEEKIQLILEGKDPNALQAIPAAVDPTITDPVSIDIQPELDSNAAPEVEDPTQASSDEQPEEPPVSIENPLSVDPLDQEVPEDKTKEKVEESTYQTHSINNGIVSSVSKTDGEDPARFGESPEKFHELATRSHPNAKMPDSVMYAGKDHLGHKYVINYDNKLSGFYATHNSSGKLDGFFVDKFSHKIEESAEEIQEALRLVSKHGEGKHTAKVYKDPEWEEHRVKFYVDGKHNEDADYHTTDIEDAKGTAEAETKRLNKLEESAESLLATDAHLTEEFKVKAKELFEAELVIRTKAIEEEFTSKLAGIISKLEEEKQEYINTLSEKIDTYLDTISESWAANNKPILESNAQIEISNSFMKKMKDLFEEHNIEVPESKRDIVIEMETKLTEMQSQLETLTETLQESSVELSKMNKEKIINESIKGMTELDQARMIKLIEDVEYDNQEGFGKKIQTLKESVFMKQTPVLNEEKLNVSSQVITESGTIKTHSPIMELYLKALQG